MINLRGYTVQIEPIERWPGTSSDPTTYENCRFKANWSDTCHVLTRELDQLDARRNVVLQMDVTRSQLYVDGSGLKAKCRPNTSAVILSFDTPHGPMMFPCDTYADWRDNVRAIALALEALRKVNRYGVTSSGQQYRGFQPLPAPTNAFASREAAWGFLCQVVGLPASTELGTTDDLLDIVVRKAVFATHPDQGGDADRFKRVMEAERMLKQ